MTKHPLNTWDKLLTAVWAARTCGILDYFADLTITRYCISLKEARELFLAHTAGKWFV